MTVGEVKQEKEIKVNDFICFERIGADREWKNTLGKVLSFPTSNHVRVEFYDRVEVMTRGNPLLDQKLQEIAAINGKLQLWEEKVQLDRELEQVVAEEDKASASLFKVREATLQRQAEAATRTRATMEELDERRHEIERIPQRQWRDMRAPGRPTEELVSLARAIMLALREDHATSWESMQAVMRRPDFMSRVMQLDCTVTPLPKAYRRKILTELGSRRRGSMFSYSSQSQSHRGASIPQGTQIEVTMHNWLLAQITCSEAREAEEHVVDECVVDNQEQVLLVREVNGLREKVAMLEEQITDMKKAICGNTAIATLMLDDAKATTDTLFYRRMDKGRVVTEIILRESVLVVFGEKEEEDDEDGNTFVRLTEEEVEQLRTAVKEAKEAHDLQEMEALLAAEAFEEQQILELKQRMEELRRKENFTEEDEEEMRQLDALLLAAIRRLEATQCRIRQLQQLGRDRLVMVTKSLIPDFVDSTLNLKFSGDKWGDLVNNTEHVQNMEKALTNDLSRALGLPTENFSNFCFTLGSLLVNFDVRHSADVKREQLQALANEADFSEFCGYYEKVTFKTTYPINTPEQEAAYEKARLEELVLLNFTGAGLPQKVEDFDDDFSDEGASDDEDYRRPRVQIGQMRNECAFEARYGYPILGVLEVPLEVQKAEMGLQEGKVLETEVPEVREAAEGIALPSDEDMRDKSVDEKESVRKSGSLYGTDSSKKADKSVKEDDNLSSNAVNTPMKAAGENPLEAESLSRKDSSSRKESTSLKEISSLKESSSRKEGASLKEISSLKESSSRKEGASLKEGGSRKEGASLKEGGSRKEGTSLKESSTHEL